ncbi:MAG: hypothetical protein HZB26_07275 [Candidatus Hydrogenedentes bacterium]|nr:hypothetical protein [Candidatus Hydrogenedentota bacterium]
MRTLRARLEALEKRTPPPVEFDPYESATREELIDLAWRLCETPSGNHELDATARRVIENEKEYSHATV